MKKKLAVLMAICLVAGTLNGAVQMPEVRAAEVQQEKESNRNFTCNVLGNNSVEITKYTGQETELEIPSEIDGKTVTSIGSGAFSGCSRLTSIKIPSSVTSIAYSAFRSCSRLTSIKIPSNVKSIGDFAFYGCSRLTDIEIPSSVTSIGDCVFNDCSSLTIIKVEEGNLYYDSRDNCNAIIAKKNNELIYGCKNTIIPSGVTSIGESAFFGCSRLTSIEIPTGVTSIEKSAFEGCNGLTRIEIPSSVANIGYRAFFGCNGLTSIKVEEENLYYDSRENCNAIIKKECNELIYGCKNTIIPSGVTSIGESAFYDCSGLASLEIPSSVTVISGYAFSGCSRLTSIEIPSSVTSIGDFVFYGCSRLANLEISSGVTNIGESAFSGCSGLTSIKIPSSVTNIGRSAFSGCSRLARIKVEEENLYYDSRDNCNAIIAKKNNELIYGCKNTIIPSGVTSIGESAFYGCSLLTSLEIPSSVTNIRRGAFADCSSLNSIAIPDSVALIGQDVFRNVYSLTIYCAQGSYAEQYAKDNSLTTQDILDMPKENLGGSAGESGNAGNNSDYTYSYVSWSDSISITGYTGQETKLAIPSKIDGKTVTDIGSSAFRDCRELISLEIPSSVTSIGESAFSGCSRLTSIEIPSGVTNIDDNVFNGCSGLTRIKIPLSVTYIGSSAFEGCSGLTSIEIPSGVASIGDSVFYGCSGLTSIEIPSGITSIKSSAFYGCSGLTGLEIPSSVTNIGSFAFGDCSRLTSLEIPLSVTSIGNYAFYGCSGLTIICSKGSYAEQYAKENNFAIKYVQGTPDQNPTEKPGTGDTEEPGKEPTEKPGTGQPGNSDTEEPGKEPTEKPGTETPGTPGQNPTEKPGNGSADKPAVSLDGKTVQTITAEDIVKTLGDAPFYLDAETDGDGTLTYESKNPDIVKVDGTGKATIISAGTAKISVTASATGSCSSAKKVVTVTVIPEGYTAISDIADLYAIRNNPGGNYILVNDIDMSATQKGGAYDFGRGWTPIESFDGVLDGNGHRIVGMHIFGEFEPDTNIGLFGICRGDIKNLGMINCNINCEIDRFVGVGAIAGFSIGDLQNCYANGKINTKGSQEGGLRFIGGLVGKISGWQIYADCYNACEIDCTQTEGEIHIGGINGSNTDDELKQSRCYNAGVVQGNGQSKIGAICSEKSYKYYSQGRNLYYLKGTALQGFGDVKDDADCVALTETQMKNPKLFTGFDFANTWEIDPYCSYPYPQLKNNRMVRINSIQLKTAPAKLTYSQGESLRLNGAALELSYEDGINTTIPLEKDMLSGYNMNRIGRQTVTVSYGGEETSFDIEVKEVQVSGISIPKTLSLNRSKQKQLTASITPANASNKSITWESDNPGVASVNSSGLVKAKAKGRAVITATASNGKQAKCTVTVLVPAVSVKLSHSSLSMAAGSRRSIKAQLLPLESTDSVNWKSSNKSVAEVYDGSVLAKKEGTAKITAYTKSGAKASCTVTVKKSGSGSSSEIKKITSKKAKIKSAKNAKKRSVTLKLSGSVNGGGYKIQYSTSRKFKGAKTVTAKGNTATIKKLKAKKTYYIRARIYKKISGKMYYGKWSGVKSVKIKK